MQYLSQRLAAKPAPKRGESPQPGPLADRQRERILDAAELLVAESGCAHTSIEAIVKAAGVSTVTFYERFEGKEECFVAAFDRAVDEAAADLREAAAGDPATGGLTWSEGVATGLRAVPGLVAAEPARARLCLVEAQTGGPRLSRHFDAALDRVAAKLREGRALPTAPADLPPTHEEATAGALAWLLRERLERGAGEGLKALYPELIDIALAPYLGGGESAAVSTSAHGDG
jgi:AcrR family transcriptional regulator